MVLFPAIARLTALPGVAGASWTKRFKELLVIAVREGGRGLEGKKKCGPGALEMVQETGKGNQLG